MIRTVERVHTGSQLQPVVYFSLALCTVSVIVGCVLLNRSGWIALLPAAFVFGWTQICTPCGTALIWTLAPIAERDQSTWMKATIRYTLGGLMSASLIGMIEGWVGARLSVYFSETSRTFFLGLLSVTLLLREMKLISFQLPQRCRPSNGSWRHRFGIRDASLMWGIHIGLGVGTFFNYGGPYLLGGALMTQFGGIRGTLPCATLMAVYWAGRAISVWLTPILRSTTDSSISGFIDDIKATSALQRKIHAVALGWSSLVIVTALLAF